MEINYRDSKLRKLCENNREAVRKLGADSAKKLQTRHSDMAAAANVEELPPLGNPHPLTGDRNGQFSIGLAGGMRLVFEPDHKPVPHKEDGGIHWGQVTAVTIIFIGDYHD